MKTAYTTPRNTNFSLWGYPHGQCVTCCIRQMAALSRSIPHCCANFSLSLCLQPRQKPPLCKGRWAKSLISSGGVVNPSVFSAVYTAENPAPFTQGSLSGALRIGAVNSNLSALHLSTEEACRCLRQLLIRLLQGRIVLLQQHHDTAHQITL